MEIVEVMQPHRIGHGIQAVSSADALKMLKERNICVEICPTSNLQTHAVDGIEHLGRVLRTLIDTRILFTINTDNPYLSHTNLRHEISFLLANKLMSAGELRQCFAWAEEFSFIR